MSNGDDDLLSVVQPEERNPISSKVSYTREFLLSLCGLEICKRLPKDFDESLLSEFGSSALQGFRRNDYGSSPPGKGETGNFSRGVQRWDSRASGRSDADSQSDGDSDSGRRYGNQFRWSWQNPEHDGLLGSGSFPRPPGYGAGASVPRYRSNDQQQLNRSSDPYHFPRPYKAVPHSRRETKDSYNDETFGWAEKTSEDRVEEERKRRAEFEMLRTEQQRELKEKLKSKAMVKLKDDALTELAASLDTGDDAIMTNGLDTLIKPIQQNDSGKISMSSQGHPLRPRVPPGFANAAVEKISGPKSLGHPGPLEIENPEFCVANQDEKSTLQLHLGEKHSENTFLLAGKGGNMVDLSSSLESSKAKVPDERSLRASNISGISEILQNGKVIAVDSENVTQHKIMGEAGQSTSILEKLFGDALSINSTGPSNIVEDHNVKIDDVWSPKDFHTSKFAHWFLEEEKKTMESGSLEKSNDLLSLIVGEKSGLIASERKTKEQILPVESNSVKMATPITSDAGASEALYNEKKPETISAVLTCEDLEQSFLSGIGESGSSSQPPVIAYSQHDEIPKADIDNNASKHLLSLLQKGASSSSKPVSPIFMLDKGFPKESQDLGGERIIEIQGNVRDGNAENLSSGKGLTLETLFGTAFMKELQAADAPGSVQMNSAGSSSIDVSEPFMLPLAVSGDGASTASVNEARSKSVNKDDSDLRLGGAHQTNLEKDGMDWLNVDSSQTETESSSLQRFDLRLPEEESLTGLGVSVNAQKSMFMADLGVANAEMLPSFSNTPDNIAEKLVALGASVKDERPIAYRQDNVPFPRGPDMVKPEIPYPSMHAQTSPQFNPTLVNRWRPMFHPLDPHAAHVDAQFNFMPPEGITHPDAPAHANVGHSPYRHPIIGLSEFDHPIHPMLQQMHMPNNISPSHVLPGFPGGTPPPPHPGGNPPGYVQQHNLLQGFLFNHQHPDLGGLGMPLPGPEHGGVNDNPPQAFQRLLEMELRSKRKLVHPSFPAGGDHSRPMYGHELDSGFWHR